MIQKQIQRWLNDSLAVLRADGVIDKCPQPQLRPSKRQQHGDYSSNIAMTLARQAHLPALQLWSVYNSIHSLRLAGQARLPALQLWSVCNSIHSLRLAGQARLPALQLWSVCNSIHSLRLARQARLPARRHWYTYSTYRLCPARQARQPAEQISHRLCLTKQARLSARQLAEQIITHLPDSPLLTRAEVAGAGFINFYVEREPTSVLAEIAEAGERYGHQPRNQRRVLVEFVSANPTGPLHIGHGRAAAYGETLCSILNAGGYDVEREYYLNDRGRQVDILAVSVWLRYLELKRALPSFPSVAYQGDYIYDVAADVRNVHGASLDCPLREVFSGLPPDNEEHAERHMDAVIRVCRQQLGESRYALLRGSSVTAMRDSISRDLRNFGVSFQSWFSEDSLYPEKVAEVVDKLDKRGFTYSKDGALWFRSSRFHDEKDRVMRRADGSYTYLAGDIAYHADKFERGYDLMINIWGADHHGYVARLRAAMEALGFDAGRLRFILFQFVALLRNGQKVSMSTRSGEFLSLRGLCEEVGRDAGRLFYVMRKAGQHVDFDLDLAASQTSANPVYYIQYAHARICSVFRQAREKGVCFSSSADLSLLLEKNEEALVRLLMQYPSALQSCLNQFEPLPLVNYLRELAACFHAYYNSCQFLVSEARLCQARLSLIAAVRQLLSNGLGLLGSGAPERM